VRQHGPRFLAIVAEARNHIRELSVADVRDKLARGERFRFFDVREQSEYAAGHLPGAEIVVYCGGGYRSALAADNLRRMGYTNVWSMFGGFRGWTEAGNEVEGKP